MYEVHAKQFDGTWYRLATFATRWQADEFIHGRGGFKRRAVQYRIVSLTAC
jgi:hypothetical protein